MTEKNSKRNSFAVFRNTFRILVLGIVAACLLSSCTAFYLAEKRSNGKKVLTMDPRLAGTPAGDAQKKSFEELNAAATEWVESSPEVFWHMKSFDGHDLVARYFEHSPNTDHKYIIFLHGYQDSYTRYFPYTNIIYHMGYNVLTPALRAHTPSGGRFITFGAYESQDIVDWCKLLVEKDPEAQIGIIGVSMGASSTLLASALDLPSNVKCIVADSAFANAREQLNFSAGRLHLPAFPVVSLVTLYSNVFAAWDPDTTDICEAVSKTQLPILFSHGTTDTKVPFSNLAKITSAYSGPYSEVITFEANHVAAFFTYPKEYFAAVEAFLARFLH